jgi:hypothetical protein
VKYILKNSNKRCENNGCQGKQRTQMEKITTADEDSSTMMQVSVGSFSVESS